MYKNHASDYDAFYFSKCLTPGLLNERPDHWILFFGNIADHIATEMIPDTVLDVGCAMGFLVESLRERGIRAFGVDFSDYAIQKVSPLIKPYCWVGSVNDSFPQKYDLIVCIEVLEHLSPAETDRAIRNMCLHSERILFSSTPEDYKESTHQNVQPVEYWTRLFARNGFFHDLDYDASFIAPWAMLFHRKSMTIEEITYQYERKNFRYYVENLALRQGALENRRELAKYYQAEQKYQAEIETKEMEKKDIQEKLEFLLSSRWWRLHEVLCRTWLYSIYKQYFMRK